MKKFISIILLLTVSICAFAQNISGSWEQTIINPIEFEGSDSFIQETMTLLSPDVMNVTMDVEVLIPNYTPPARLRFRLTCSGNWSYSGNILTKDLDVKTLEAEVLEVPEDMPKGFGKFFSNTVANALKKEMKKESRKPVQYKVVSLTSDTLTIETMGKEAPEATTYTRK